MPLPGGGGSKLWLISSQTGKAELVYGDPEVDTGTTPAENAARAADQTVIADRAQLAADVKILADAKKGEPGRQGLQQAVAQDQQKVVADEAAANRTLSTAAPACIAAGSKACFAVGARLLTPDGSKAVEDFKVGDLLLSRSEDDENGPVEAKQVLETFARSATILELHVNGQVIKTTAEHPFYVAGRGWVDAGLLREGDLLTSLDGGEQRVRGLVATPEYARVYNLRVADWHTYFVGCQEWGFSVWAHNVCLYHYTDADGYKGISAGAGKGLIKFKASQPAKKDNPYGVYFTLVSPDKVKAVGLGKLGLINDKVENYFLVDVPDDQVESLDGGRGVYIKYVPHDLVVPRSNIVESGKTGI